MPLVKRSPASPQKIAANRGNARKSTGPRTATGKRRVALNALRRGRFARNCDRYEPEPTEGATRLL